MSRYVAVLGAVYEDRGNFFNDLSDYCANNGFELKIYPPRGKILDEAAFASELQEAEAVFYAVDPDAADYLMIGYWAVMIENAGVKYPVQIMFNYENLFDPDDIVELSNAYSDVILAETGNLEITERYFKKVFYDQKKRRSCSTENDFTYLPGMDAISSVLK